MWDGFVLVLFTWLGATQCWMGLSWYCSRSGEILIMRCIHIGITVLVIF